MPSRFRRARSPSALLAPILAAGLLACGSGDAPEPGVAAPAQAPLSGSYRVSGTTVDKTTGAERGVAGTVIVIVEKDRYTSTFDLTTTLHASGTPQKAQLVGRGDGSVEGRTLSGTAETQLIVALVPGVDAGFGLLPRMATARILNRSTAEIAGDGSVTIQIDSEPAPGAEYTPTRTTLRGLRTSAVGLGGEKP
jgi:hypothetical protein